LSEAAGEVPPKVLLLLPGPKALRFGDSYVTLAGMAVYRRAGSKHWYIRFSWHGEQIHESSRSTSKRHAERLEAGLRARLARGESRAPAMTFPLPEAICRRP